MIWISYRPNWTLRFFETQCIKGGCSVKIHDTVYYSSVIKQSHNDLYRVVRTHPEYGVIDRRPNWRL